MPVDFPPRPQGTPAALHELSPLYRRNALWVLLMVVLFVAVYFLLLFIAVALAYYGFKVAVVLMKVGNFLGLAAGAGIIALSLMCIAFLVKFIFARFKDDASDRFVITEEDQPELFDFVRKVCEETHAPFPKKITLSPRVNAAVYYNSSFWSLFFPVRKNLELGWPLIQSLNTEEFKAVLAHEFGHFSQSTTRLGSYIYTVNRVIYNIAYSRDKWDGLLHTWASIGTVFAWFAVFTHWLTMGVRHIMHFMYGLLNKSYMALSREMEFHADSMAVSVTGSEPICSALLKIEYADYVFRNMIMRIDDHYATEKKLPGNLFSLFESFASLSVKNGAVPVEDSGLPAVSEEKLAETAPFRKIKVQNLWASHPSFAERKKSAYRFPVSNAGSSTRALVLLKDNRRWEKMLSEKMISEKMRADISEGNGVADAILEKEARRAAHPRYKGFYNNRFVSFTRSGSSEEEKAVPESENLLFAASEVQAVVKIRGLQEDLVLAQQIEKKLVNVRSFEYDDKKCDVHDASWIIKKTEAEIKALKDSILEYDKTIYCFYRKNAGTFLAEYEQAYHKAISLTDVYEKLKDNFRRMEPLMADLRKGIKISNEYAMRLQEQVNEYVSDYCKVLLYADQHCTAKQFGLYTLSSGLGHFLCPEPVAPSPRGMLNVRFFTSFCEKHAASLNRIEMLLEQQQAGVLAVQDRISYLLQ